MPKLSDEDRLTCVFNRLNRRVKRPLFISVKPQNMERLLVSPIFGNRIKWVFEEFVTGIYWGFNLVPSEYHLGKNEWVWRLLGVGNNKYA